MSKEYQIFKNELNETVEIENFKNNKSQTFGPNYI